MGLREDLHVVIDKFPTDLEAIRGEADRIATEVEAFVAQLQDKVPAEAAEAKALVDAAAAKLGAGPAVEPPAETAVEVTGTPVPVNTNPSAEVTAVTTEEAVTSDHPAAESETSEPATD